ncbi:hypothetical protein PL321_10250 [Caloramator sp. mosi_1]|uniref:hypothetical protein n=1 Tax=Caloramator sp. mosi_1 TaxID=3023090 RepID=UPI002361F202|nr:hypothetical protein [Caloramator sp. mosi_1]WDC83196.1 hypothetical protein PL321_10250 [Caloramator sp. mosi_1]
MIPIIVVDNEGFTGAFKKSFKFGFSNLFNILGVFLFYIVIGAVVGLVFSKVPFVQTLVNSYMVTLVTVYVVNKYIEDNVGYKENTEEVTINNDSTTLE